MAKQLNKEELFENYFSTASEVLATFEDTFAVNGVWSTVFGTAGDGAGGFTSADETRAAKDRVRQSSAWGQLSALFDYAVDGRLPSDHAPEDTVIGGAEVLSIITIENCAPAEEWDDIARRGDARFALDTGTALDLERVALLAEVDVRTVRNAVSAGELVAHKVAGEGLTIDNSSARQWLLGRRGFKPTITSDETAADLSSIKTPAEFAAFLAAQRRRIGLDTRDHKLAVLHPAVDARGLRELEAGVFRFPIDAAYPLADFYRLDRTPFLGCVMRVFFNEQLMALRDALITQ